MMTTNPSRIPKSFRFRKENMLRFLWAAMVLVVLAGCGDPPLNPIEGKVTLGGKSYERLLVYFRPIGREVDRFTLGVGETDKDGILVLRSTAGDGLAAGKYRVCFNCYIAQNGGTQGLGEKSDDDRTLVTKDIVPPPYNDPEASPVEFEIRKGETNTFEYDIPTSIP